MTFRDSGSGSWIYQFFRGLWSCLYSCSCSYYYLRSRCDHLTSPRFEVCAVSFDCEGHVLVYSVDSD